MPDAAKRPCCICRRWFRPDTRVGSRQRTCCRPECQTIRRKKTQSSWRARNPDYFIAWRIQARDGAIDQPKPVPRLPHPLSNLPWDIAEDEFGLKGACFVGIMGALLLKAAKDQFKKEDVDSTRDPVSLPRLLTKDQFKGQITDST
jgi:hypothetical protein